MSLRPSSGRTDRRHLVAPVAFSCDESEAPVRARPDPSGDSITVMVVLL
jgi:hypothetical protein